MLVIVLLLKTSVARTVLYSLYVRVDAVGIDFAINTKMETLIYVLYTRIKTN